jgi:hypothetical protein
MPGFTLRGKVQLDGSQWKSGLDQASREADRWSNSVTSMIKGRLAAAFAVGAIVRSVTDSLDQAGRIRDKSNSLGVSTDVYQQLEFAAEQSGASIDNMAAAIKRLGVAQIDAERGSKDIIETFERLGISTKELKKLSPDELFLKVANIFKNRSGGPTDIADAQKVLGRSGSELLPAFRAGLGASAQQAVDAGVIIPNDEVLRLAAASDQKTTLEFKARAAKAGAAASSIEQVSNPFGVFRQLGSIYEDVREALREFREHRREVLDEQRAARKAAEETAENTQVLSR